MHFKPWNLVFALVCLLMLATIGSAATWFVDATATGNNDGTSWEDAFVDPQDAIDAANPLTADEVWVAAAVYVPTTPVPSTSTDPRARTLNLLNGIKVYGGFLGLAHPSGGETSLGQRNPEANETRFDGDLGIIGDPTDNCFSVVTANSIGDGSFIDGFTITNGYHDGGSFFGGGGMVCYEASPRIVRCRFISNYAAGQGGGLLASFNSSPAVASCQFLGNTATTGGGAALTAASGTTFSNCVFVGNVSAELGSAINVLEHSYPTFVINCSLSGNVSGSFFGGAIAADDDTTGEYLTIAGSILWGNEPAQISLVSTSLVTVRFSDVEDGLPQYVDDGGGNIDDNPLFVTTPDPGADDEWGTSDDDYGDLRLQLESPCINAADNDDLPADFGDLNSNSNYMERTPRDLDIFRKRVLHGTVEMGAYEFGCNADLTNDCEIDGDDQAVLLGQWTGTSTYGGCPPYRQSDLNEDCKVNGDDLAILLGAWGECDACGSEELGGGSSEESGCEGSYELFLQWLGAEDWEAFLEWYECLFGP